MVNVTDWLQSKSDAEQDDSVQVRGTATAPGAGAVIATVNAPKTGIYEITAIAGYGGTADVVDNMELAIGGTAVLQLPVYPVVNGERIPITIRRRVNAGQAIAVRAIAAGGVGSIFLAHVIAKRMSG